MLKHISKDEAESFRIACGLAFSDGWISINGHDVNTELKPNGIDYGRVLSLRDAGLIHEGDTLQKQFRNTSPAAQIIFQNNGLIIQATESILSFDIPVLVFTSAGKELQNLIDLNPCIPYLTSFGRFLRQKGLVVKKGIVKTDDSNVSIWTFEDDL